MKKILLTTVATLALAGCASSASHQPGEAPQAEKHEHKWPMPEMEGVHDVLGPAWHDAVEKNNDKTTACAAVPGLKDAAVKLVAAKVPEAHQAKQAAFTEKAAAFQSAVETFEGQCAGDGPADLKAAFSPIHDAFHGVMDLFKKKG